MIKSISFGKWIKNTIFRNTVFSLLEMSTSAILMLITTPYLLLHMGPSHYGLWSLCLAFLGLAGAVDIGLGAATIKFVAEYKEKQDTKNLSEVITISIGLAIILGLFFSLVIYFLLPSLVKMFFYNETSPEQILAVLQISILGLFPLMLENVGVSIPRGFQDYQLTTVLITVKNAVITIYAVWVVYQQKSVPEIMIGTIAFMYISSITSIGIAFYKARKFNFSPKFSVLTLKKVASFMAFMGITGIGIKIFTFFDRIVVSQVLGLTGAAYYTIATGIANKIAAFASAATQALFPAFSSWGASQNKILIWKKLKSTTLLIGVLTLIPGTVFLFLSRDLVFWWLGEQNGAEVLYAIQILIFIYMIKTLTAPSYQAANGLGHPWVTTLAVAIASIGTIILIFYLGPRYGLAGVSWANIASWSLFIISISLYFILKNEKTGRKKPDTAESQSS
jgi:O-antigen/teichoic acid export membrane protein